MLPLKLQDVRQSASSLNAVLRQLCRVVPPSLPQFHVSKPAYPKRYSAEAAQGICCTLTVQFAPDSMAALVDCFQVCDTIQGTGLNAIYWACAIVSRLAFPTTFHAHLQENMRKGFLLASTLAARA